MRIGPRLRRGVAVEAALELALLFRLLVVFATPALVSGEPDPSMPPIVDAQGRPMRSAITSLEPAMIGGATPGGSQMAWSRRYNADLEKHFIVVNWDQHGAGRLFTAERLAGASYPTNAFRQTRAAALAEAPEYTPAERERLPEAEAETFAAIYPAWSRVDLAKDVPTLGFLRISCWAATTVQERRTRPKSTSSCCRRR